MSLPAFLPRIFELAKSDTVTLGKEAFWVISNIAAGPEEQIENITEKDTYIKIIKDAVVNDTKKVTDHSFIIENNHF